MGRFKAVLGGLTRPSSNHDGPSIGAQKTHGLNNDSRTFMEINKQYKDFVNKLEETDSLVLLDLSREVGPAHGYTGLGWHDLFSERTDWKMLQWIPLHLIRKMSKEYRMNEDCMFRVWFCHPGFLHVEVDDNGEWTVEDVLGFPDWMLMG